MLVLRPARLSDLGDLMEISRAVGTGMTSMPANEGAWVEKLTRSVESFGKDAVEGPGGEVYFLVLEDTEKQKAIGTTAIYAGVGLQTPFYSYKLSTLTTASTVLQKTKHTRILSLVNDYTGTTEIGSLYLSPDYRKPGVGQFLSRSRYLMMRDFPERFGDLVIAEMRGYQTDEGRSPFWDNLGEKFFGIAFENADKISAVEGTQFISDLMPKYPIYMDLLPQEAQEVIGKPHKSSSPALKLLEKEGFAWRGYVDVFDGGPSVECHRSSIRTIQHSRDGLVRDFRELEPAEDASNLYIVTNRKREGYRLALIPMELSREDDGSCSVHMSADSARGLKLAEGDAVAFCPFKIR